METRNFTISEQTAKLLTAHKALDEVAQMLSDYCGGEWENYEDKADEMYQERFGELIWKIKDNLTKEIGLRISDSLNICSSTEI